MSHPVGSWSGQRVLITGGSSGIGAALARELAGIGATVGICARRTALLEDVLADCRRHVPYCRAWTIDLSQLEGIDRFMAQVEDQLGGVDILVNNAAIALSEDAITTPWDQIEHLTRLDYLSPVRLTMAALPAMRRRGSGHVVAISSMAARMSTPGEAAYAAAKSALATYFEALAAELWDTSIGIHLVYPALIDLTPGVDGDDALALTTDGSTPIPAAVCARQIRLQLERGDLQLYVPETMRRLVAQRAADLERSIELMANWYRAGSPH